MRADRRDRHGLGHVIGVECYRIGHDDVGTVFGRGDRSGSCQFEIIFERPQALAQILGAGFGARGAGLTNALMSPDGSRKRQPAVTTRSLSAGFPAMETSMPWAARLWPWPAIGATSPRVPGPIISKRMDSPVALIANDVRN